MRDLIIINFKTYKDSTGAGALKIAKAAEKALGNVKGNVILVPQSVDLRLVSKNSKLKVFAQHVDLASQGSHTGSVNIDALKDAGARGVLINHSEKGLSLEDIELTIHLCKEKNLISVVCTKNLAETEKVLGFNPDFVAIEPPELIGGEVSISDAEPLLIKKASELAGSVKVLCGAGIHTKHDVHIAKRLGASGVLVASGVVKAKNVEKEIVDLLSGFKD